MDTRHPYLLPVSILIGGIIIAVAVYMVRTGSTPPLPVGDISKLAPVTVDDHIVGTPEATLVIVEYSDIDCEYCKNFYSALSQLMSEYGAGGEVAWVYRHFPNVSLHGSSALHAEAAECVAEQGGGEAFFRFIDALNQEAPGGSQFDSRGYPSVVTGLGLSVPDFNDCMESDRMVAKVTRDFENAFEIGADGAPYSVLIMEGKEPVPISGALPYDALKEVIETSLGR